MRHLSCKDLRRGGASCLLHVHAHRRKHATSEPRSVALPCPKMILQGRLCHPFTQASFKCAAAEVYNESPDMPMKRARAEHT